jgi:thiol-disulfide isomerase/thioredoxin
MLSVSQLAPVIPGVEYRSGPTLVVFLETDCPTCRATIPYLNRLARSARVVGISQDSEADTKQFEEQLDVAFPVQSDPGLALSRAFDPMFVPTMFLLDADGRILKTHFGFEKSALNAFAADMGSARIAEEFDGAPSAKPGCMSRHLEPETDGDSLAPVAASHRAAAASRIDLADDEDVFEYCFRVFGDALPVIPPTPDRVKRMLSGTGLDPAEIVARVPPCYGEASVEKIAANAVMAGCEPKMMRVLAPLIRAVCDERFNIHGVQATTHFAAPLIIFNGPVRSELGFSCRQNVFSNVARANSTLGRALQLILLNIGGGRPQGIDMSVLGNPGKFSYCIAEHEEAVPWQPLHVEQGLRPGQSALTLFAGEPPHGVSEHNARKPEQVLKAICYALATVWTYRDCMRSEAIVILCPEHATTVAKAGWTKRQARDFLFENTGIPIREYETVGDAEGSRGMAGYREIRINGEPCYQKFKAPEDIRIVVAGGTAGKFSAVIGSWATGPRGSQMVTYPIQGAR